MMSYIMFNPQTLNVYYTKQLPEQRMHQRLNGVRRVDDVCIDIAEMEVAQQIADQWQKELVFGKPMKASRLNIVDVDEDVLNTMVATREAYAYDTYPEMFV